MGLVARMSNTHEPRYSLTASRISKPLHGKRILVVDDNRDAARLCAYVLEQLGAHADIEFGGARALKQMHVGSYDVVLLNYMMPDMDGLHVARRYREYGGSSPIILTSACSADEITNKAGIENINAMLSTPFQVSEMVETVSLWVTPRL